MKHLKNKMLFFLFYILNLQLASGQDFSVNLIKVAKEKELITNAITSNNKDYAVVKNQIISVANKNDKLIIAPIISTAEKDGGCYLQSLKSNYQLGKRYLIEKNEDVQSCDAVIAVFGCRLAKINGLGVIAGIRLGANNYYGQSSFFDFTKNNELKENPQLSKKIGSIDSVGKAKNKLGCIK